MYSSSTLQGHSKMSTCTVHVQFICDQDHSKEEQQTRPTSKFESAQMAVVLSNRKAALVNIMVLKARLFWVEKK